MLGVAVEILLAKAKRLERKTRLTVPKLRAVWERHKQPQRGVLIAIGRERK